MRNVSLPPEQVPEDTDFAVEIGQRSKEPHGTFDVTQRLSVGDAAGLPNLGADFVGIAMARPVVQVGGYGYVTVVGVAAGRFPVPLIPAGSVVNQDHSGKGAGAQRLRHVGPDGVPIVALNSRSFRQHSLIHVGLIHD